MQNTETEGIKGLILNLFRRKLRLSKADLSLYDTMLLGYHDGMALTRIKEWSDFSPNGVDRLLEDTLKKRNPTLCDMFDSVTEDATAHMWGRSWEKQFSEVYPVKLLFPRKHCCQNMENKFGFDFKLWEHDLEDTPPLFAALLLNATKQFVGYTANKVKKNEHRLSIVAENIFAAIRRLLGEDAEDKNVKTAFQKLHCGLFQCIGYYDYALLFLCDDWNLIYRIEDQLKSWKIDESINFIASNYLLLGMSSKQDAWKKINSDAKCKMSIQISLREGRSAEDFYQAFKCCVKNMEKPEQEFWERRSTFYQINGGADCIILTESPGMKYLLKEFSHGGILTPSGKEEKCFFSQYISSIQTSACRELLKGGNESKDKNKPLTNTDSVSSDEQGKTPTTAIDNLYQWLNDMRQTDFLGADDSFFRRAHTLQQQLAQYENMVCENHVFDICAVLQPTYETLYQNLSTLSKALPEYSAKDREWYKQRIYRLLSEFYDHVGHYQEALRISDPHFIESSRINHPSIGSSTKILLTFNHLLNGLDRDIGMALRSNMEKRGENWDSCTHHFLLSCGRMDKARAWNLSEQIPSPNPMNQRYRIEQDLMIIHMPERSILDIRGTLLRSLHELWHVCGHRMRTFRCHCIIQDAANCLATVIANILLDKATYLNVALYGSFQYRQLSTEKQFTIKQEFEVQFDDCIQNLIQCTSEEIVKLVMEQENLQRPQDIDDFYYGERIFDFLKEVTMQVFLDKSTLNGGLWKTIYICYEKQNRILYQTVARYLNDTLTSDILWKLQYWCINDLTDENIQYNIQALLDYLVGNHITIETKEKKNNSWEKYVKENTVAVVYDLLAYVYQESFSDNMSCCTVQCTLEEYILSFVHENPNVQTSLSNQERRAYRIGAILEHHFHCEPKTIKRNEKIALAELNRENLTRVYRETFGRFQNGTTDNEDKIISEIIDKVNKLWMMYLKNKPYISHLKGYLEKTEEIHGLDDDAGMKYCQAIRIIYHKARNMNTHEQVMNVVQELLRTWAWMAEDEQI